MKEKFVIITALAFSDQKDTQRLSEFASKGLQLKDYRIPLLSYKLVPKDKQDIDYLIDYHQGVNQEYLKSYSQNGWNHVFTHENLHFFSAVKGTIPFYTDVEGKKECYKKESKRYALFVLISLFPTSIFGFLLYNFRLAGESVTLPLFILTGLSVMSLIICTMPFITYHFRAERLER